MALQRKMRMKLNKSSQLLLVTAASLLAASLLTACETLTVDFVYVSSALAAGINNYGLIDVFEINSESGKMRQIPSSPFPSGGRRPVAEAVSADNKNLFVVNQDDNSIVQFVIGSDGKLYPFNTANTPGIFPMAVARIKQICLSWIFTSHCPLCSDAKPCSGSVAVYPLNAATSSNPVTLGTPLTNNAISAQYWPLTALNGTDIMVPTAVNLVASGSCVFVAAYDSSVAPHAGYVFGFAVGSGGTLSAIAGSPFAAGTQPTGIASDASSTYLYVSDSAHSDVLGFTIGATGVLTALSNSPFAAGNQPSAVAVDPNYPYVYVTNAIDGTVTAYSMTNGALTTLGNYTIGSDPVAIGIDPSTEHFLFTANFLDNTVSGFQLSTTAGTLLDSQFSPFSANAQPNRRCSHSAQRHRRRNREVMATSSTAPLPRGSR